LKDNRIIRAFAEIKAENSLKENTLSFLQKKTEKRRNLLVMRLAAGFACALLLFLGGVFSYQSYFTVTAYVDIDVNPSMELALNRYGRVISVSAYNDDGTNVLARIPVKNKEYGEALRLLVDEMYAQGYIQKAELFSITLQADDKSQEELLRGLNAILSSLLSKQSQGIEQDIFTVDSTTKIESHSLHLSPAKYLAIQELQAVDPSATFESCRSHTISEIREQTHAHQGGGHGENNTSSHESGHHPK
jgi:hypothetical protein